MALLGEMRRRNIFKVSLAYAIVSWLIVQVADVILPAFDAPQWIMQVLVLVLILLFPIAVLLSWAYELTPEGFKASADVDRTQSITVNTGKKLNHVVIALLTLAILFLVLDNYIFRTEILPDPDVQYRQSIAVIPFANRSAAEENAEFFADGVHDELLTRLGRISDLRVISRTSVMEYRDTTKNLRQIGEELGVGSILQGSVQRAGIEIRVNVQLIDARNDEHIWADTYDRELSAVNIFAIQSEISTAIADALEANLSDSEQAHLEAVSTEDLDALEAYFRGKLQVEKRTEPAILAAIEDFQRATSIDPEFAGAWAGLAEAWLELPNWTINADPQRVRRQASSAAIRAVNLNPELPDALAVLGWHLLLHNYDWQGAENAFRQALQIEATNIMALHWYSHLLSWQGKHADAIAAARLAVNTDPLSASMRIHLSYILIDAQEWNEAFSIAEQLMSGGTYPSLLANTWVGALRSRQPADAADLLNQWAAVSGRDAEAAEAIGQLLIRRLTENETVDADETLIDRLQIANEVPELYAALGDAERTIAALQIAINTGTGFRSLLSMKINPSYDFIRDDPRFIALLTEIGLQE